jgi:hypothetical protein
MVERRAVGRIPVTFRASFGPTWVGLHEGMISDLTMSGCRLESPAPIPVNTYLGLWLQISSTVPRIVVELAAVAAGSTPAARGALNNVGLLLSSFER